MTGMAMSGIGMVSMTGVGFVALMCCVCLWCLGRLLSCWVMAV